MVLDQIAISSNPKNIVYKKNIPLKVADILSMYRSAPLLERGGFSEERIATIFKNSNLVFSAWDGEVLVGLARCMADFGYVVFVCHLVIRKEYQKYGIGKELLRLINEAAGETSHIMLHAEDAAFNYYPKVGFTKNESAYIIRGEMALDYWDKI